MQNLERIPLDDGTFTSVPCLYHEEYTARYTWPPRLGERVDTIRNNTVVALWRTESPRDRKNARRVCQDSPYENKKRSPQSMSVPKIIKVVRKKASFADAKEDRRRAHQIITS